MIDLTLNPTERRNAAVELWERWANAIVSGNRREARRLLLLRRMVVKAPHILATREDADEIQACSLVTRDWDDGNLVSLLPEPAV